MLVDNSKSLGALLGLSQGTISYETMFVYNRGISILIFIMLVNTIELIILMYFLLTSIIYQSCYYYKPRIAMTCMLMSKTFLSFPSNSLIQTLLQHAFGMTSSRTNPIGAFFHDFFDKDFGAITNANVDEWFT